MEKAERVATTAGRLARWGFTDPERSARFVESLGPSGAEIARMLGATADPDLAARLLADLAEHDPELVPTLLVDEATAPRLLGVLGASVALGEHLLRHPDQWRELADPGLAEDPLTPDQARNSLLRAIGADPGETNPRSTIPDADAVDRLRVEYRRLLLRLAARDLAGEAEMAEVARALSDLAGSTLEAALAIARTRVGERADVARLAVVAMGKCGGRELNYVSDVDVIFAVEPAPGHDEGEAISIGATLASNLMRICSDHTAEGTIWPVDAALRPEGKQGPLVRTVASHVAYYERWASTWEFQALLKARPVAGDHDVGQAYRAGVESMIWEASRRENFVADVQAMRRRVVDHIPAGQVERQIKLGPGGLRDVEFAVQLLQLVHGRGDESLRSPTTLTALAALTDGGYVGRDDGRALDEAYRFLRTLEHRMQLYGLRRTHVVPSDEASLRRLARSMGYTREAIKGLEADWHKHSREVRRLHEKLFYRPLLEAVAKLPAEVSRLTPDAAVQRLHALGFSDPTAALRHLESLTSGVSRTAAIQRQLLPAMLGWFAEAPEPDLGLRGFRQISDTLGSTHWYLRLLRDEGQAAERMAKILASSRFATDLLQRAPEGVALLGEEDGLEPLPRAVVEKEMLAAGLRQGDPVQAITAIRAIRRRELFRIASADVLGEVEIEAVGEALTAVTAATLHAALAVAEQTVATTRGLEPADLPSDVAVVSMGRLGGHEQSYSSDADVMFVFRTRPGADPEAASQTAFAVANELRRTLALPGTDPALEVDANLRPEGKKGPLVRSLDSYARYYATWSQVWEAQALLRAEAVIGDPDLCADFTALIDPIRFPRAGLSETEVREIRRIKARVDKERLPRGADPKFHLKLGRGGLSDIEWTAQLLQMQHAGSLPGLRTTRTVETLDAAQESGLIDSGRTAELVSAWQMVSRVRNAITLVRGNPGESVPHDATERAAVAQLLGYPQGSSDQMVDDYLRLTRRARQVVDDVFWGDVG